MFYPVESRINGLITIKRERLLPRRGDVLVKAGDDVAAVDVIARAYTHPRWRYLDVAGALRIRPDAMAPALLKTVGDTVEAGEPVASRKTAAGLFRITCKSPAPGTVAAIHAGRMLIEEHGESYEMHALLRGRVANVLPGYGAVIETKGAYLRGAWSIGESAYGVLKVLSEDPTHPLQASQMDIACHRAVLVAGWCASAEALKQAEEMQVRGIVLGSMDAGLFSAARNLSIPVVLTEGIGDIPMNTASFRLFQAHRGSEAALICPAEAHRSDEVPEIIIPLPAEGTPPTLSPPSALKAGQKVRLIGYPRLGGVGIVIGISTQPRRVESGQFFEGIEVAMENQETLFVPWQNVEPIG